MVNDNASAMPTVTAKGFCRFVRIDASNPCFDGVAAEILYSALADHSVRFEAIATLCGPR